ncbi:hypothetical protein MOC71_10060 [Bacillus vallismortis]|uniref:Uncharacterized protein n=1 Tax=Bacillus vallismortis TaxID=72361 RepID=A0AAP3FVH2_BACVA|nr:hypothetical protein [Bacillus vallismortis]MCY8317075.1 hypothetical protein [Bacillus vallismortis]
MKKSIKQLVIVICFSLIFTTITIPIANAKESSDDVSSEQVNVEAQIMKRTLEPLLELIDQMPEDVAEQGINSGIEWLNVHKGNEFVGYEFVADGENLTAVKTVQESIGPSIVLSKWSCISSAAKAIAVNAIPWAKILKVKKAAKLMGGLNSMTKTIITAYKHQRNLGLSRTNAIKKAVKVSTKILPDETQKVVLEFFSLGDVVDNCCLLLKPTHQSLTVQFLI